MEQLPTEQPRIRAVLQQLHPRAPHRGAWPGWTRSLRIACALGTYGRRGRAAVEAAAARWLRQERAARMRAAQAAAQPTGFQQWVKHLAA
jgi:hypothetical protein